MNQPLLGELSGADHARRVAAVAGALAESGVTRLALEYETDAALVEFEVRATDLPGLLADAARSVGVHARGRTLIAVTRESVTWVTHDADIDAALRRAKKTLGG
jgi:hypothetical protein